jgi:hypothetical protein
VKRGGVVGCWPEDESLLCCWWWGVACRELKGRLGVDSGYVLHCSLCKSEQWRVKRKNIERWMRSMKKLLRQNLRLNLIFSGPMNQTAASFFNQTPYYLCLNKNIGATAKTNGSAWSKSGSCPNEFQTILLWIFYFIFLVTFIFWFCFKILFYLNFN